jgi:hypothetical protein
MAVTIRASGILRDFPARTEADLYLFTARHLHELRQRWGDDVAPGRAVRHFRLQTRAERSGRTRKRGARKVRSSDPEGAGG